MSEDDYIYNSLTLRGYVPTDIYAVSGEPPPPVTQYLSTSGGTMKGPINMNGSPVMNLPAPVAFQDAGNKKYIDDHDALVSGDLQDFKKLVEEQLTVLKGSIIYAGTYNASNNTIDSVTPSGGAFLTVGSPLPAASAALEGFFVIVSTNGNGVAPAPTTQLFAGDWIISVGTKWTLILKNGVFQTASAVSSIPSGTLSATNVQNALNELDTEKFPVVGGTLTGPLTVPNLTVTSSCTVKDSLTVGDPGITIKNGTGADFGKTVIEVKPGKQLVVNGGFAVNGTDLTNPIPATRVSYDNTGSSLNVPNVQEGLFSLALKCDALGSNIPTLQNDVTALRTQTTALTGRVTNLETDLADVRVEADGTKVTVTALSTAVNAQTLAIEAIRTGYLPTTGGNLSGALQVAGGLSVGGSLTIGKDASPFIISKPNGTILNIDGPVGGKVISDVPISYSAAAEDLLVTKGYVDQSDSALSARISYLEGNVIFMGTYDAAVNKVEDVSAAGVGVYVPGQPLPKAIPSTERNYLIVSQGGTGTGEAPAVPLLGGDWLLSTGSAWKEIDINDTQYLPVLGGTMQGPINMGNNSITNIKTPVNPTDAAGKGYVDSQDVVVKAYADSQDVAVKAYTDTRVAAVSAELTTVETQINGKLADLGENIQYGGTYNATSNTVVAISPLARGLLTVGAALPAPGPLLEKMFVLVSVAGTGTAPAPTQALVVNSWIYCTGTSWIYYPMTGSSGAVDASAVTYNGTGFPTDHNVASALNTAGTAITGLASEQDDLLNSAAVCWGTYDVVTNKVVTATPEGIKMGYVVGSTLPAGAAPDRAYYRVSADGTGTGAAVPNVPMKKNDWIYGNGTSWIYYPMTGSGGGTGAYLPLTGGEITGPTVIKESNLTVQGDETSAPGGGWRGLITVAYTGDGYGNPSKKKEWRLGGNYGLNLEHYISGTPTGSVSVSESGFIAAGVKDTSG
ncbi:MAG: hypothetical protein RR733_04780, partial [Victivallaceae bacterium]